jgi:hypothetical protein
MSHSARGATFNHYEHLLVVLSIFLLVDIMPEFCFDFESISSCINSTHRSMVTTSRTLSSLITSVAHANDFGTQNFKMSIYARLRSVESSSLCCTCGVPATRRIDASLRKFHCTCQCGSFLSLHKLGYQVFQAGYNAGHSGTVEQRLLSRVFFFYKASTDRSGFFTLGFGVRTATSY